MPRTAKNEHPKMPKTKNQQTKKQNRQPENLKK